MLSFVLRLLDSTALQGHRLVAQVDKKELRIIIYELSFPFEIQNDHAV